MSNAKARGPKQGYNSDEKQKYREDVWRAMAPVAVPIMEADESAHVMIMPSKEGLEIGVAISMGIPESRIVAVDENAALIATSSWRKKYPAAKFYACKVSDVPKRAKKDGIRFAAANLDLCNNFSEELLSEVESFCCSGLVLDGGAVSVTIAKGREGKAVTALMNVVIGQQIIHNISEKRMQALVAVIFHPFELRVLAEGKYTHNRVPMSWTCLQLGTMPFFRSAFSDLDRRLVTIASRLLNIDQFIRATSRVERKDYSEKYNQYRRIRMKLLAESRTEFNDRYRRAVDAGCVQPLDYWQSMSPKDKALVDEAMRLPNRRAG